MSAALTFTAPPPGLDPLVDFSLDKIDGADGLYALQANKNASLRLFVLDAAVYLPAYQPAVPSANTEALDLPASGPLTFLVVANPGEGGTTVNLMAPILVNLATGQCTQVILDRGEWPVQAELADYAGQKTDVGPAR
ncbi:flagellar assembly protein FliW [Arthrobacter sp. H20]|uniref:flagellar assembly protein FliW n=1 Tax=Arthrobacter sp. H20 TaxID=1267981 RepID=UPI00047E0252|nr:flagellar assembly protein FliW [Arthrobacter sp. H20]